MNILVDALPDAIEIGGVDYPIHADFRTGIEILLDFESEELTQSEKMGLLIYRLYGEENPPEDTEQAILKGVRFLNADTERKGVKQDGEEVSYKLYSFERDAGAIFAAFWQVYRINLLTANLHWWTFTVLFANMGGETPFGNMVSLRDRVNSGKATKEEQEVAAKMGEAFEVEDQTLTSAEQAAIDEFERALHGN